MLMEIETRFTWSIRGVVVNQERSDDPPVASPLLSSPFFNPLLSSLLPLSRSNKFFPYFSPPFLSLFPSLFLPSRPTFPHISLLSSVALNRHHPTHNEQLVHARKFLVGVNNRLSFIPSRHEGSQESAFTYGSRSGRRFFLMMILLSCLFPFLGLLLRFCYASRNKGQLQGCVSEGSVSWDYYPGHK